MDNTYEQIISPKKTWKTYAYYVLVIAFIIILFLVGSIMFGMLGSLPAFGLGLFAFLIAFPRMRVEYEYSINNANLTITAIFNANKRQEIITFNVRDAKLIAPEFHEDWSQYKSSKINDYTSGKNQYPAYTILIEMPDPIYIKIEPDDTMIESIKSYTSLNIK